MNIAVLGGFLVYSGVNLLIISILFWVEEERNSKSSKLCVAISTAGYLLVATGFILVGIGLIR